ncbi:hypothetical protein OROMI_022028 [Orobanche minor]
MHHHHPHPPTGYGPYAYDGVVNGNPCPVGSIVYPCGSGGGVFAAPTQKQLFSHRRASGDGCFCRYGRSK